VGAETPPATPLATSYEPRSRPIVDTDRARGCTLREPGCAGSCKPSARRSCDTAARGLLMVRIMSLSLPRLSFVLLLAAPACVEPIGSGTTTQSIIGGETANPADYPSVVALEDGPGDWFCTGTLIAPSWVLTAAHCVDGETATTMHIRFDDPDVNDGPGGTVVAVASIHAHPDFNYDLWDNDVALVELITPVTDRTPTAIARDAIPAGTQVLDVGYGVVDNNDNGGGLLRKVAKVTADCAGANDPGISNDNLLCMDASDGRGSCFGDSGGPTFATIAGTQVVAGVTSGGTGNLCGAGWDLYTSVHGELAFIDSVLSGTTDPDPDPMPDPDPDPTTDPPGGDDSRGGCSTGGGGGWAAIVLAALVAWRRRRA